MKQFFLLVFAAVAILSCRNASDGGGDVVTLNFDNPDPDLLSEIIVDKKQIWLQNDDEQSLFQTIDKLIIKDDVIYILDWRGTRSLFTFDMTGKFLGRIGRQGNGPGEYPVWLNDFAVDNENNVLLVDNSKKELHKYTSEGKFIESVQCPFFIDEIRVLENSDYMLVLSGEEGSPEVVVTDPELNVKEELLRYTKTDNLMSHALLKESEGEILYHGGISDTMYLFSARDGQPLKKYAFDFGGLAVPTEEKGSIPDEKRYRYIWHTPLLVGKYMTGHLIDRDKKALFCIDTESGRSFLLPFEMGKIDPELPNMPLAAVDGSTIVAYFDYNVFMGIGDTSGVDPELAKFIEEGGTVLELFTLKK